MAGRVSPSAVLRPSQSKLAVILRSPFLPRPWTLLTPLYGVSFEILIYIATGPTICLAFNNSSQSSRFEAIPELDAIQFLSTRKESYTPSCIGSIGSPVIRLRPTTLPSACSSCSAATIWYTISKANRQTETAIGLTAVLYVMTRIRSKCLWNNQESIRKG